MSENKTSKSTTALIWIAAFFLSIPLVWLPKGFVLSTLWGWYVVPFFGLQALPIPIAMGILLIVNSVISSGTVPKDKDIKLTMFGTYIGPWLSLFLGWLIKVTCL